MGEMWIQIQIPLSSPFMKGGKRGIFRSWFLGRSRYDGAGALKLEPAHEQKTSQPDTDAVLIGFNPQPCGIEHLHFACLPQQV